VLFRTVFGPELASIFHYIQMASQRGSASTRSDIQRLFLPQDSSAVPIYNQNVDDALSFLESAGLIIQERDSFHSQVVEDQPFPLLVLNALRTLENGGLVPHHPLDPLYTLIITEVFVKPDNLFVADLHTFANSLPKVKENGGLSREKIQAWKRVMEFLGVGYRAFGGFMCVYSPQLLTHVIDAWSQPEAALQTFFEAHLVNYLPFGRADDELAQAVRLPLSQLAEEKVIQLYAMQDSPSRTYMGTQRVRGIRHGVFNDR
jgi:hypothetical protein